jgi:hypothetical protein
MTCPQAPILRHRAKRVVHRVAGCVPVDRRRGSINLAAVGNVENVTLAISAAASWPEKS